MFQAFSMGMQQTEAVGQKNSQVLCHANPEGKSGQIEREGINSKELKNDKRSAAGENMSEVFSEKTRVKSLGAVAKSDQRRERLVTSPVREMWKLIQRLAYTHRKGLFFLPKRTNVTLRSRSEKG
jgi:hypothetical protein